MDHVKKTYAGREYTSMDGGLKFPRASQELFGTPVSLHLLLKLILLQ